MWAVPRLCKLYPGICLGSEISYSEWKILFLPQSLQVNVEVINQSTQPLSFQYIPIDVFIRKELFL
jgi:hypothetical protein